MQVFTKFLLLTLLWSLVAAEPSAAQTTSQKQWQNERSPAYRFPRMPREGPVPFLPGSRAAITKRTASTARDSNTTLIGRWIGGACYRVAVAGTKAYFGNGLYLMIADVSDPGKPTELGRVLLPGIGNTTVSGNLAYVATGADGLRIIDVSDPTNPTEVGFLVTGGWVSDVAVSEKYAYLAVYGEGLRIIDVSDPTNPIEVGITEDDYLANDVALSGDHAYVADEIIGGLRIIDVSNPAKPFEVGFFKTYTPAFTDIPFDLAVRGNFVYVADQNNGVRIINVSDPANPTEVGFFDTEGSCWGVAVSGDFVYVADGIRGLRIIFVAIPASPIEVGFFDTAGLAGNVAVSGNYAYVADNTSISIQ